MVFETILNGVEILRIEYPVKEYAVVRYLRKVLDFLATLFLRTVFSPSVPPAGEDCPGH